jgi:hypothetical protein
VRLDSLSVDVLGRSLLDPVHNTFRLLQRLRENEAFLSYLQERKLRALPLVAGVVLTSLTFTVAMAAFITSTNAVVALLVMLAIVPIVLIGSFWVQAHVLLSWLEERSLVKLLPGGRSRDRGPVNQWFVRVFRIDMGPPPRVPWIPALVFLLLPAAVLTRVAAPAAAGLAALLSAAAVIYAARDPVFPAGHGREQRGPAPTAASPARMVRNSKEVDDLDFTAATLRSRLSGATRRARSFMASGLHRFHFRLRSRLHSLGSLLLLNFPPLVEYGAFGAGIFLVASGRQSGSNQNLALGAFLVGAALLFAGLASIVTRRMSFRFFSRARSGYAGATARITGMMQLAAGGLAVAAAQGLASQTWDAKLQALLTNPWPLLIPLGVLLIGAGLLLVRLPGRHHGPAGIMLFVVPKVLTGAVVLGTGIAILVGWIWKIYDVNAFLSFVHLYLDENTYHLEKGWHTVIAWLR